MKIISSFILLGLSFFLTPESAAEYTTAYKLVIFEGSDWCSNCRRLEKNVLSKADFVQFLEDSSIQVEKIDFPQRKKLSKEVQAYNSSIADKYGFEGVYPTLILARNDSPNFFALTAYANQSVDELIKHIKGKLVLLQ